MTIEIVLTPAGTLVFEEAADASSAPWTKRIAEKFAADHAAGLFGLAATKPDGYVGPSVMFWQEFATTFMTEFCRNPEVINGGVAAATEPPPEAQLEAIRVSAPPMRGAEYLSADVLRNLWNDLDSWVRKEIAQAQQPPADWLKKHAPIWHQVGRVCFHLAENARDEQFPFAFLATYAPRVSTGGRVQYQPLSKALQEHAGERNKKALINLLSPVHVASEKSRFVKQLLESNDVFHPLRWTPEEAYLFLKDVPMLEESGLLVRMPDWWRKRQRPQVKVTIGNKKQEHLSLETMLDFQAEVALGDTKLSSEELKQLMNSGDGLVYLKGQWVEVDRERLSQALQQWDKIQGEAASGGISFVEGMRLLAGAPANLGAGESSLTERQGDQWSVVDPGSWLADVLARLRNPQQLADLGTTTISRDFRGTLRPYQYAGHRWLQFVSSLGLGACLADDMGLGKTIQIISVLLSMKEETAGQTSAKRRPSLLVLPASLLANWKSEIERFAPSLSTCFLHPSQISSAEMATIASDPQAHLSEHDLIATTYGMLLRQQWLNNLNWRLVILDEAQAIKNPAANQTRAVKKLKSEARIALTGTPIENRLGDLWSLFDFLSPGLLGSTDKFKRFIQKLNEQEHPNYAPLRNLVSPYILRRLKTDKSIITDLPDKTELKTFCGMAPAQAALYSKTVDELKDSLNQVEGIQRRGLVLSYLLKFKQVCNHPSQLLGDGVYEPEMSGKFQRLRAICEEIASRQEKVLVFTQFREMTEPLAAFLAQIFAHPGLVLHGGTAVGKRKGIVDTFQAADGPPFVVLSLKAGGTGLNLTNASHVVHFDRWWNPAVENQATDRAYRIGQHRNVLVHKFICQGTVEEKIDALISDKVELAEGILAGGGAETMLTEMSDRELIDLVSLDLDRVTLD